MGAQLRRYGEQALEQDIINLLQLWNTAVESTNNTNTTSNKSYLSRCSKIFISCSKSLQHVLFQDHTSQHIPVDDIYKFSKNDPRIIRQLGFMINKPTLDECCRVFYHCSSVEIEKLETLKVANILNSVPTQQIVTQVTPIMNEHAPIAIPCLDPILEGDETNVREVDAEIIDETPLLSRILVNCCYNNDTVTIKLIIKCLHTLFKKEMEGSLLDSSAPVQDTNMEPEDDDDDEDEPEEVESSNSTNAPVTAVPSTATATATVAESINHLQPIQQLFNEIYNSVLTYNTQLTMDDTVTNEEILTLYLSQYRIMENFDVLRSNSVQSESTRDAVNTIHNKYDDYKSLFHYIMNYPEDTKTFRTPLHIASISNNMLCVSLLLETGVCNPSKQDVYCKTPYHYCMNTSIRKLYRTSWNKSIRYYEQNPTIAINNSYYYYWNWNDCGGIPVPVSKEVLTNQKNKKKEKKKRSKVNKKEMEKELKEKQEK